MVLPAMDDYLTFLRHNQWRLQDELSAAKARGKVKEARQIHKRLAKVNWQIDQIYLERDPHRPQGGG